MTNRQILLRMLLIVAAAETAVMLLLRGLNLPERIDILLDAPLLALLCAPLIYWFVVRAVAARICCTNGTTSDSGSCPFRLLRSLKISPCTNGITT